MVFEKLIHFFSMVLLGCLVLLGCGTKDAAEEAAQRDFEKRLQEAQELARQIRDGGLFDEDRIRQQRIQEPDNVCMFSTNYITVDFGPQPDFRADGVAALYNDKNGVIYYYDFAGQQRYKMHQYGQHPTFGALKKDGTQKYIFQDFEWVKTDDGLHQNINGILMNTEDDWLKPSKKLYDGPASHPYFVNDDKHVIFKENNQYFMLDENLKKQQITEQEYILKRDSRYDLRYMWKIETEYRGMKGLWITDLAEKNWVQLRDVSELKTIMVIPTDYALYCWGSEFAGVIEIIPTELPEYSIKLNTGQAVVGDLFDIYEKRINPINQEVIGYHEDKLKSTLRVVRIIENIYICEFQTKMYMRGIYKDDIAVSRKDSNITGWIL
jgi:hypothetical protein